MRLSGIFSSPEFLRILRLKNRKHQENQRYIQESSDCLSAFFLFRLSELWNEKAELSFHCQDC